MYTDRKLVIFISSTSDLETERKQLIEGLRPIYDPYAYEEDRAQGRSPESRIEEMIQRSDVFVGIVGGSYGTPESPTSSIVQWEFDTAKEKGLMPMMFVRQLTQAQVDPRQQKFIEAIRDFHSGVWCKFFQTPTELLTLVVYSLQKYLSESLNRYRGVISQWLNRILLPIAILVPVLLLVAFLSSQFTQKSIIFGAIIAFLVEALCLVLLRLEVGGKHVG